MSNLIISKDISDLENVIPKNKGIFVIIDNKLKHFYNLFSMYNIIEIETSEKNKTLSLVEQIINKLLEKKADRNCFLLGVGGGITTDICGFTASIYKRGVSFGFVPTTLLAQCDASIGGKNGVNFNFYKNIIGTINQASFIYINPTFLDTLPKTEIINGSAEILKTFILFDKEYYKICVNYFSNLKENEPKNELLSIIKKCANYKQKIVDIDQYEKNERRLLNLGHTFAHAIEKCINENIKDNNGITISHGEAVSIGIVYAAKIAERLNIAISGLSKRLHTDLISMGLPTDIKKYNITTEPIINAIINDKKIEGEYIHFILPCDIGNVIDKKISLNKLKEITYDLR